MPPWRSFLLTLHLAALGLWLGITASVAATAAIAFPTAKAVGVRVLELPESATDQHRFVAGRIAQNVFLFGDTAGFICALLASISFAALLLLGVFSPKRPGTILRALALGVALAAFASLLLIVTPGINSASQRHFAAAKIGDTQAATEHAKAVDDLHPIASNLFAAQTAGLLIAFLAGLWTTARRVGPEAEPTTTTPRLPTPALLKS